MGILLLLSGLAFGLTPPRPALPEPNGTVKLDGVETPVHWDDGDTFFVPSTRTKARLQGFNTLEGYGAVHRFGPGEKVLFDNAKAATDLARSKVWSCTLSEQSGGYGRKTVDCPDLRRALLEGGLAHVFSVAGPANADDLGFQQKGIDDRVGMWVNGAPKSIVTSVHSVDEKPGATDSYNRVLDIATGEAKKQVHQNVYKTCEWVCVDAACLLYVPYSVRYGEGRAACLAAPE